MIDKDYSMKKAKELATKIGDPEDKLRHIASYDQNNKKHILYQLDHYQWKDIKTIDEIANSVDRIDKIVHSDDELPYSTMLLIFRQAFMGVKKLSIIDHDIDTKIVDQYINRLENIYQNLVDKNNVQSMND